MPPASPPSAAEASSPYGSAMTDSVPVDLIQRLALLEAKVEFLTRSTGVVMPSDADLLGGGMPAEVVSIWQTGNKIEAIKRYREITGSDLGTAKAAIDALG